MKNLESFMNIAIEEAKTSLKEGNSGFGNRFYVFTTVYYKHWTGPVYFNLIRPLHHLAVPRMARYGLNN
jgi:hypothetical protein